MMTDQDITDLADSWLNGNRSHVLEVIESFTKTGAMALVGRITYRLARFDHWNETDHCGDFARALERFADK